MAISDRVIDIFRKTNIRKAPLLAKYEEYPEACQTLIEKYQEYTNYLYVWSLKSINKPWQHGKERF